MVQLLNLMAWVGQPGADSDAVAQGMQAVSVREHLVAIQCVNTSTLRSVLSVQQSLRGAAGFPLDTRCSFA